MNVLVLSELDEAQLSDLAALLVRCAHVDGHPALAEPQRAAADTEAPPMSSPRARVRFFSSARSAAFISSRLTSA